MAADDGWGLFGDDDSDDHGAAAEKEADSKASNPTHAPRTFVRFFRQLWPQILPDACQDQATIRKSPLILAGARQVQVI